MAVTKACGAAGSSIVRPPTTPAAGAWRRFRQTLELWVCSTCSKEDTSVSSEKISQSADKVSRKKPRVTLTSPWTARGATPSPNKQSSVKTYSQGDPEILKSWPDKNLGRGLRLNPERATKADLSLCLECDPGQLTPDGDWRMRSHTPQMMSMGALTPYSIAHQRFSRSNCVWQWADERLLRIMTFYSLFESLYFVLMYRKCMTGNLLQVYRLSFRTWRTTFHTLLNFSLA